MTKIQAEIKFDTEKTNATKESFLYRLDILKMEIETLDRLVSRMDEMTQAIKNWAISIWTGSLAIALSQPDYRRYVFITAVAPLLFWYIDAYFRRLQRRSIFRGRKISDFLNSPRLVESFCQNELGDFIVYDLTATQYREFEEYKKFVSLKNTFLFPEIATFYSVLTIISLCLGLFFLLNP
jgi:uncharacterized membrane protein